LLSGKVVAVAFELELLARVWFGAGMGTEIKGIAGYYEQLVALQSYCHFAGCY
jgi:hypothetical protein